MLQVLIRMHPEGTAGLCPLCEQTTESPAGLGLVAAGCLTMICSECGRRHAPGLAALLRLARTAERVGRMTRHTLVPPLPALLDLARAAEDYAHALAPRRKQAA